MGVITDSFSLFGTVPVNSDAFMMALIGGAIWHWIWQEAGKPNNGHIYHIMKRTRHQYHYAIRLCKKSKQMIQKQKLAENISQHVDFWKELKKINPITKCTTEVMDQVNGNSNITELLLKKI